MDDAYDAVGSSVSRSSGAAASARPVHAGSALRPTLRFGAR
jgi:hypothetical protein